MRHIICNSLLAPVPEIDISEDEYRALAQAREVLSSAFAIEEKYEIVIFNFEELEKELLAAAVCNSLRRALEYSEFFERRSTLNVRLVNLLTATRLYLDQLPQHVRECIPQDANAEEVLKAGCSREYDQNFEYRFMEALRNHVQHRGIPVHFVRQDARWTSHDEKGFMEFTVDILAQRGFLEEDDKFKKAVLRELDGDVDLKAASRRYIESISAIHALARELIATSVASARSSIEARHTENAKLYSGSLRALTAVAIEGEYEVSAVPLLLDWDDVRIELQRRNVKLTNLSRMYATGKLMQGKR